MLYLAAPFFTTPQLELVESVEQVLRRYKIPFFSPRSQHTEGKPKPITSWEQAEAIFQKNAEAINDSDGILAILDYLLPPMTELCVVDKTGIRPNTMIRLPDTGTVWEMGYGFCLGVPVYGYTTIDPATSRMNIMLTQGCSGILHGDEELHRFAEAWAPHELPEDVLAAGISRHWKGAFV